jgi:hypothetical protein
MPMTVPRAYRQVIRLAAIAPALPAKLDAAQQRHFARLRAIMADPNVIGVGVARKVIDRERTDTLSLSFHVRRKSPRRMLADGQSIPSVVAPPRGPAIFTDVVEVGEVRPQAAIARTPIRSGFSIALQGSAPGTLGAVVTWRDAPALLSAAHVLARAGAASLGEAVLYPAGPDGGHAPADVIGSLINYKPLRGGGAYVNRFDAALASVSPARLGDLDAAIPGASSPLRWIEPRENMPVRISGRTSNDARSVIRALDQTVQLSYPEVGLAGFYGQCSCDPYTDGGDSGAVVLDEATGAVVGLHFAAADEASYFSPIKPIMDGLKFSL